MPLSGLLDHSHNALRLKRGNHGCVRCSKQDRVNPIRVMMIVVTLTMTMMMITRKILFTVSGRVKVIMMMVIMMMVVMLTMTLMTNTRKILFMVIMMMVMVVMVISMMVVEV